MIGTVRASRARVVARSEQSEGAIRGEVPVRVLVFSAIGFTVLAIASYLVWDRVSALEQHVADLGAQVEEAEQRAEVAEDKALQAGKETAAAAAHAEAADSRAVAAEETAEQAVQDQVRAEKAQAQAEERADAAAAEAEAALEDARVARQETERVRAAREAELNRMTEALNKIVETRRTALGMVMTLGSDRVEFDFDRAALRPKARELLSRIVGVLLTSDGYVVQVFGHTDYIGTERYNQRLSEQRAQAVSDYLVEAGIDPAIVTTRGFGETSPLVDGTDDASRQRNRRVEIGIIDTSLEFTRTTQSRKQ